MARALSRKVWGPVFLKRRQAERLGPRQRQRFSFLTLFLAVCLVGLALLHVWVRLQVVRLGYVLSTTTKLQSQLERENRELRVEWATLTSPGRLGVMARERLGLVEPEKGQVVILR
jgi:cell division protein FtsL